MVSPTCFVITLPSSDHLGSPRTSSLDTTHPSTLGTLPEDGNVMTKYVGDTIHN
jgi:hypothetical protein